MIFLEFGTMLEIDNLRKMMDPKNFWIIQKVQKCGQNSGF